MSLQFVSLVSTPERETLPASDAGVAGRAPEVDRPPAAMLGAPSIDDIETMMAIQGGTRARGALGFIDKHLAQKLRPSDIVVMTTAEPITRQVSVNVSRGAA
ncbi:hypothetical protein OV203_08575 [Nannocystis sp. ILAH1]|uniref:hypothetical protein n=1 Tax=Nannocystis sp. ILAH1 TaxID=2996789 RepID=UPI00226FE729|nr:hypothetical protein [Nannocystis sp. ILAH1]MCY0987176.1 hypothetical protein [Nannocystis sp. ILAH1]